jgi:rhodanese-related sulfurtransferase
MPSPTDITVSQLSRLIGTPSAPIILDVRIDDDFAEDPFLIPLAIRCHYQNIGAMLQLLQDKAVVVSCQKGKKLSQGGMAILRNHGIKAEALVGGHVAWRKAGELLIPAKIMPATESGKPSVWVTRHRPKIDRMACPWLIRRFIDADATFLFVAPAEVLAVAEKFDAIPFDVEDVFWSHRGDRCSFDTMIDEFGLHSDALAQLATIVRAADTNCLDLAPQAAGLLAVSLGLSRMYRDDLDQINAGMLVYDAFYRWARDAANEAHDWPLPNSSS